jgi:DNA adenine methylase
VIRQPRNTGHLSPLRYPGGKTWLIPEVRSWLSSIPHRVQFIEPFAGGASCGLAIAKDGLADVVVLGELDENVAALWSLLINGSDDDVMWLCGRIAEFELTRDNVRVVIDGDTNTRREVAFRVLLHNRCSRGGLTNARAGLLQEGERGLGLGSRWYPDTLVNRINSIRSLDNLRFRAGDAFELITKFSRDTDKAFFVDPPYSLGTKAAGRRLYRHHEIDHEKLFRLCADLRSPVMMTYPDDPAVIDLAERYGFTFRRVPMRSTHHVEHFELLLTKDPDEEASSN